MSAPAEKARSPAPVRMTALIASSASYPERASSSSRRAQYRSRTGRVVTTGRCGTGRSAMGGCLDGVRVLELARYQAGPRGGMILSDLGAEGIKIEKIGGEESRRSEPVVRGQRVFFAVYHRGK